MFFNFLVKNKGVLIFYTIFLQIVLACGLLAVCQAGLLHHAPAVSSQNIVRHDQAIHHEAPVHYAEVHSAPVYHSAPVVHSAPIHSAPIHEAPARQEDHYVDEYVSLFFEEIRNSIIHNMLLTVRHLPVLVESLTRISYPLRFQKQR